MALTTDKQVWKIIAGIAIALSIIIILCLIFSKIFVTIVIGLALILIAEKILDTHRNEVDKKNYSGWKKRAYGYAIIAFWLVAIVVLLSASVGELREAVSEIEGTQSTLGAQYASKIAPHLPGMINDNINEQTIEQLESYVLELLEEMFSDAMYIFINGILIIPIMFHMYFRKKQRVIARAIDLVPKKYKKAALSASKDIGRQLHEFSAAKVYESVVVASICCLGFYVAGVQGWLLLGILAGLLNLIPYLGPIIGAVPPLLIALWLEPPIVAFYVLITIVVAQLVDNLYLQPFMISSRVSVNPLLTVILLLIGAQVAGILGMVFIIPVYLIYKIVLRESYQELLKMHGR